MIRIRQRLGFRAPYKLKKIWTDYICDIHNYYEKQQRNLTPGS